jgi:SAM-dependent methyltransferase
MSKPEGQAHESTYVLDAENVAEMARLRKQHELVTRNMGGLLSEHPDLSSFHDVLDIAAGPGGWVLDLASANPHMQVTGADLSRLMIDFARSLVVEQGLNNAHFRLMNILDPFEFPEASFDLTNARYMFGILTPQAWPKVIEEMARVTRPGGIVRLTEPEMGTTNDPAVEELTALFMRSMLLSGQTFSPDGRNVGITAMLPGLLRDAGLINVRYKAYATEISAGTPDYTDAAQDTLVALKLIQPYLSKMGLATQEHLEQLYQQAVEGMQSSSFRGMYFALTAWGEVPLRG